MTFRNLLDYSLIASLSVAFLVSPTAARATSPVLDPCPSPYIQTGFYSIDLAYVPIGLRISGNDTMNPLIANSSPDSLVINTTIGRYKLVAGEPTEGRRGYFAKFKWNNATQSWEQQDETSVGGYTAIPLTYMTQLPEPEYPSTIGHVEKAFALPMEYAGKPIEIRGAWKGTTVDRMCTQEEQALHDKLVASTHSNQNVIRTLISKLLSLFGL